MRRLERPLHLGLLWCVWGGRALWRALYGLLMEGPRPRRLAARGLLLGFLAGIWAGIDLVPVYWARAAWLHAAQAACRYPKGRDEAQLQDQLRHEAYRLGLLDAADQPESIRVERYGAEDGDHLQALLELRQRVVLCGVLPVDLPLRGKVEERILEVKATPLLAPEILVN